MQVISLSLELRRSALLLVNTSMGTLICVEVPGGVVYHWAPGDAQMNPHRPLIEVLGEDKGKIIPVHAVDGVWGSGG
jgi:hypothetical protein